MKCPRLRLLRLLSAAAYFLAGCVFTRAEPATVTLYDKDPQHVWNRLYTALMMPGPDGKSLPPDLLDPPSSALLQSEPGHSAAVAVLREFVKSGPRPDTMTPLRRAVMQRDLLNVFHVFAVARQLAGQPWTAARREFLTALAQASRHVALTAEEIKNLPDNYAAALAAPDAVTACDPARPGPFLPKDLLAEDGPWIGLDTNANKGAVAHLHSIMFAGRASFEVRMRHPEGRAAGEAYLKLLADMKDPFVSEKPAQAASLKPNGPDTGPWPNPDTPQFPPGTMWALVRRPLLVDVSGKVIAAPLVDSVQIRVYRTIGRQADEPKAPPPEGTGKPDPSQPVPDQTIFEWEMHRDLLLGKGGFHLTQPEDLRYSHFVPRESTPREGEPSFPVASFCATCHSATGIHGVQSRGAPFHSEYVRRPPEFRPATRQTLDRTTVYHAKELPAWVLLDWLWQEQPAR